MAENQSSHPAPSGEQSSGNAQHHRRNHRNRNRHRPHKQHGQNTGDHKDDRAYGEQSHTEQSHNEQPRNEEHRNEQPHSEPHEQHHAPQNGQNAHKNVHDKHDKHDKHNKHRDRRHNKHHPQHGKPEQQEQHVLQQGVEGVTGATGLPQQGQQGEQNTDSFNQSDRNQPHRNQPHRSQQQREGQTRDRRQENRQERHQGGRQGNRQESRQSREARETLDARDAHDNRRGNDGHGQRNRDGRTNEGRANEEREQKEYKGHKEFNRKPAEGNETPSPSERPRGGRFGGHAPSSGASSNSSSASSPNDGAPNSPSRPPQTTGWGMYVKRAMFSDYGYGYEEEEPIETTETKEELVFPPAQIIGAPAMSDLPPLYTGARGAAIRILSRVERSDAYLDKLLEQELRQADLNPLDRALLTEIVHGVLRWQSKLDWVLTGFYHGEFVKCITPVKNAMRIALYQVMFLTKIPPFAAVNESVELIKRLKGARSANLVNAVLRNILHNINNIRFPIREQDPTRFLSIMYAHPSWLVRRWLQRFGEENTEQLLKTNNERPKIALRLNPLQGSSLQAMREELKTFLDSQEIKQWESPYDERFILVGSLSAVRDWDAYKLGLFSVQDPSAAMVVKLANPQPGYTVVDVCAAPGGKSTFAAELMNNDGRVIALDKYDGKLDFVRENAERLRLTCIETRIADARTVQAKEVLEGTASAASDENHSGHGKGGGNKSRGDKRVEAARSPKTGGIDEAIAPENLADLVMVDAPCSGTGTLSKKPDIRWKLDVNNIPALTKLQREILRNAAALVKPGGVLVYSTCTIEPEENTETAAWFLEQFPEFELDPAEKYLPEHLCKDGFMQAFPHVHKTDGAFAARFIRKA